MVKIDTLNRKIPQCEEEAYNNLELYDNGEYIIRSFDKIRSILTTDIDLNKFSNRELNINQEEIEDYIEYAKIINCRYSDFNPGIFVERGSYEASFAKKVYFENELEFIISLFISHHNIHAFDDGNKRTALNVFVDFIHKFTNCYINDIIVIQDSQILYLESKISEKEFKHILNYEVRKKMFNTNTNCNLEHLIPRSEIDETEEVNMALQSDRRSSINLTELEKGQFFYQQLRKPLFQRDTNQWSVSRVEKLIKTFLDDGLIPAIILWEDSMGNIYIIDGAHRISSLIAWVNSDYGKDNTLNDSNHQVIKDYIDSQIGNYNDIKVSTDEKYKKAKSIIAKRSIAVQWVTGNYEKVKESFIRINEQGVVITEDEKELILNDKLPISKLSRAVLAHGLGQASKNQNKDTLNIFRRFFMPFLSYELNNFPLCGDLNEDLVISKIYNAMKIIDNSDNMALENLEEKVLNVLTFIQDDLNICQKVYFYGATKKFKINSFYGFLRFALLLQEDIELRRLFIENRERFEEYLVQNERHVQIIARQKRQAKKAYEEVCLYYRMLIVACSNNDFNALKDRFAYIDFNKDTSHSTRGKTIKKNYKIFVETIPRCNICNGFIDGDEYNIKSHNCCLLK